MFNMLLTFHLFIEKPSIPRCSILPVPQEVRPNLAHFRLEVLFWGLRDLKRVHFMSVDKPRIDVECSGTILSSSIIQNAKRNPNFSSMLKFFDLELPVEENYAPPITIRCVDCRSFGRYTLVGTHQITSIHKFMHRPVPPAELKNYPTIGGQIVLVSPVQENLPPGGIGGVTSANGVGRSGAESTQNRRSSCENLTTYGAACVGKGRRSSRKSQKRKPPLAHDDTLDPDDDDENTKDWWTKYFWSYEKLILESKEKNSTARIATSSPNSNGVPRSGDKHAKLTLKATKLLAKQSPKHQLQVQKNKASTALCQVRR